LRHTWHVGSNEELYYVERIRVLTINLVVVGRMPQVN
jgi:hypothetical protein